MVYECNFQACSRNPVTEPKNKRAATANMPKKGKYSQARNPLKTLLNTIQSANRREGWIGIMPFRIG